MSKKSYTKEIQYLAEYDLEIAAKEIEIARLRVSKVIEKLNSAESATLLPHLQDLEDSLETLKNRAKSIRTRLKISGIQKTSDIEAKRTAFNYFIIDAKCAACRATEMLQRATGLTRGNADIDSDKAMAAVIDLSIRFERKLRRLLQF